MEFTQVKFMAVGLDDNLIYAHNDNEKPSAS